MTYRAHKRWQGFDFSQLVFWDEIKIDLFYQVGARCSPARSHKRHIRRRRAPSSTLTAAGGVKALRP